MSSTGGLEGLASLFFLASYLIPLGAIAAAIAVAYGYWAKRMVRALLVAAVLWFVPWLVAIPERHAFEDIISVAFAPDDSPFTGPVWISPLIGAAIVFVSVHYRWRRFAKR
ncbi:MAG: hypothetical protein ABI665_11310 [Vicinamibacterales bacterium]